MWWTELSGIAGGLGLFLLGMTFLTEGLKSAAGAAMRGIVERSTRGPLAALLTGMLFTLVVQSSSATTLGFVNAGILSFSNVLGVLYGANLGTTLTGWLVSLLGFKLNVAAFALPAVFLGAVLHLFGRERLKGAGLALAGFGLLFLGIDYMQVSLSDGQSWRIFERFSALLFIDRVLLVGIGIGMTVIMQSSSAALAVTLTSLVTGAIDLPEGAALVIGQNIGTTFTAVLGSIGGTSNAKRAAAGHVLFNLITGMVALAAFSPLLTLVTKLHLFGETSDAAFRLAAFHTIFNILGVAIMMPWLGVQTRFLERVIPERKEQLGRPRYLDRAALSQPSAALHSVDREFDHFREIMAEALSAGLLGGHTKNVALEKAWYQLNRLSALATATTDYIGKIKPSEAQAEQVFGQLRVVEHYRRAMASLINAIEHIDGKEFEQPAIQDWMREYAQSVVGVRRILVESDPPATAVATIHAIAVDAETRREKVRRAAFEAVSKEGANVQAAMETVDYVNALTAFLHQFSRAYNYWASTAATTVPVS